MALIIESFLSEGGNHIDIPLHLEYNICNFFKFNGKKKTGSLNLLTGGTFSIDDNTDYQTSFALDNNLPPPRIVVHNPNFPTFNLGFSYHLYRHNKSFIRLQFLYRQGFYKTITHEILDIGEIHQYNIFSRGSSWLFTLTYPIHFKDKD